MNPFVPLLVLGTACLLAARHRAWRGTAALVAASLALCGAGSSTDEDASLTLGAGGSGGSYLQPCGPAHRYGSAAVDAEYRTEVARNLDVTAGLRVTGAVDRWTTGEASSSSEIGLTAQPMVGLDHPFLGGAVGAHLGRVIRNDDIDAVFPAGRLRIGPRSVLYVEAALADHFAGSFPGGFVRGGVGVGLPPRLHDTAWNHPVLEAGISDSGVYVSPQIGIGERVRVDVFGSYGDVDTWRLALGVRYRPRLRRPSGSTSGP